MAKLFGPQIDGITFRFRLGRATLTDRKYMGGDRASVGLPHSSKGPNSLKISIKEFLTSLPNPKMVRLPDSLILWSGIFCPEVQRIF